MIDYNEIKKVCDKCKKEFIVRFLKYPCKLDEKRESYITCPYCQNVVETIYLDANEEIIELKI